MLQYFFLLFVALLQLEMSHKSLRTNVLAAYCLGLKSPGLGLGLEAWSLGLGFG